MKILVLSHMFPDQNDSLRGIFVFEQASALKHLGANLQVLSGNQGLKKSYVDIIGGIPVSYFSLPFWTGIPSKLMLLLGFFKYFYLVFFWLFKDSDRRKSIDIIHAHFGFPDAVVGIFSGLLFRIPVIITLHGSDFNVQLKYPVLRWWLPRVFRFAHKVICVSRVMKNEIDKQFPFLSQKTMYLPNGYKEEEIYYDKYVEERNDFLFVGRLSTVKNVDILLRAFAAIKNIVTCDLLIAGAGDQRNELEKLSAELQLGQRVRFLGAVAHSDLNPLYNSARSLVLPSRSEGMPIVVLEAFATGTPVLASSVGALPDLVINDDVGYLFQPGNVQDLAAALVKSSETEWRHSLIAESCGDMTWLKNASRLQTLYLDILEGVH